MSQIVEHHAQARTVTAPAGPIALLDTGGSAPAALFVPGYTGSKEDFAPVLDPLHRADADGGGRRVVAMDQRGQYQSTGVPDPAAYTVAALADELLLVVDDLGGTVDLVGHSFGGLVARAAVIARPEAFRSLVLLDSGPSAIGGERRERMQALEPLLAAGGMAAVHAALEQLAQADPKWVANPQELKDFLRDRFIASDPIGLQGMGDALRTEPDRTDELAAAGVPVLVAYGVDDDAWPPAVQAEMAARLGVKAAPIEGAAHSPGVENPAALVEVLRDFWEGLA